MIKALTKFVMKQQAEILIISKNLITKEYYYKWERKENILIVRIIKSQNIPIIKCTI